MGTSWGQTIKEESKYNPGILEYTRCQSAAFTYSLLMMFATTGITFGVLRHDKFKPIHLKHKILLSFLSGSFGAWYLARVKTQHCQDLWLLLDKRAKEKAQLVNQESRSEQ